MRKIIRNRQYDTGTAELVGEWADSLPVNDFHHVAERLYRKRTGEYFIHGRGGGLTPYARKVGDAATAGESIVPLSYDAAREWAEAHLSADEYISAFGEPEEGDEGARQVRVDGTTFAALRRMSEESGQTMGAVVRRAIGL